MKNSEFKTIKSSAYSSSTYVFPLLSFLFAACHFLTFVFSGIDAKVAPGYRNRQYKFVHRLGLFCRNQQSDFSLGKTILVRNIDRSSAMPPQQDKSFSHHQRSALPKSVPSTEGASENGKVPSSGLMAPTTFLPLLVFVDMFAVALVVPLLFQYYKNAGVTSANQRELLSSVFSSSQIVGGIVLGAMTDAKLIKRKTVLYLSFGGSAVAYGMIVYGGFRALILSRVLVGLVKQTMTVTTSILTRCTTEDNRAKHMGRYVNESFSRVRCLTLRRRI